MDSAQGFHGWPQLSGSTEGERMPSTGLARETRVMRQEELGHSDSIRPLDWLKILPHEAAASSDRLGWVGLEAAHFRASPASECNSPALTHHRLVLFAQPPEVLDLLYNSQHHPNSTAIPPFGTQARLRAW
jgi:hypothetical protein